VKTGIELMTQFSFVVLFCATSRGLCGEKNHSPICFAELVFPQFDIISRPKPAKRIEYSEYKPKALPALLFQNPIELVL